MATPRPPPISSQTEATPQWLVGPAQPSACPDQVHVWAAVLQAGAPQLQRCHEWLSDEEADTAAGRRFEADCNRYIVAHGFMREVLSRYLGCAPQQVRMARDQDGKPYLAEVGPRLSFNLSHSDELALLAVTSAQAVGVDVERVQDDAAWLQVADQFFSADELAQLGALPPAERVHGFFACWTRKEAFIKAVGKGLRLPLEDFSVDVSLQAGEPRLVLHRDMGLGEWRLRAFTPARGYAAAVACQAPSPRLRRWRYRSSTDDLNS